MKKVTGYLELSALNSGLAYAYLKDAEDEFAAIADNLEECLESVRALKRRYSELG